MPAPTEHEHDFRRVYAHDINPNVEPGGQVVAVVCCVCGKSPLEVLEGRAMPKVERDWPDDLRITNYFHDIDKGSTVEFQGIPPPAPLHDE